MQAKILLVDTSADDAADRLYRREINRIGSRRRYNHKSKPGSDDIVVKRLCNFRGVDTVLYTQIRATISNPDAVTLASRAIASALELNDGRDGITYLIDAKKNGINTKISDAYEEEIKKQLGASDLADALRIMDDRRRQCASSAQDYISNDPVK